MPSSVYIHIPFCKSICSYCDFCMFYYKPFVDKYLLALNKEIKEKYIGNIIKTLYIGGGSPSSLSIDELKQLFEILRTIKISRDCEITIEVNINDIEEEKLKLFHKFGVNRVSIGIETVNQKFFSFLNRYNKKDEIIKKIGLVKKYFNNINIDMMYAFPSETLDELKNDLDFVTKLEPSHISIYSLIIEEHTKLFIDKTLPLDEEEEEKMYYYIIKYLSEKGYNHYEISNFSLDGKESQHNLVYWNNLPYYGFGLGASGYIDDFRYSNTKSLNKYIDGKYIKDSEIVSKKIMMENEMMLGLRKTKGVNKKEFYKKYSLNLLDTFDIMDLINKKLLIDDKDNIYIPSNRLYVSNSIIVNFIGGCLK